MPLSGIQLEQEGIGLHLETLMNPKNVRILFQTMPIDTLQTMPIACVQAPYTERVIVRVIDCTSPDEGVQLLFAINRDT